MSAVEPNGLVRRLSGDEPTQEAAGAIVRWLVAEFHGDTLDLLPDDPIGKLESRHCTAYTTAITSLF
jgi:hypothetical protein